MGEYKGFADINQVVAAYEATARMNRCGDWAAFVAEAKAEPASIGYEMQEHWNAVTGCPTSDEGMNEIFAAAQRWVTALTTGEVKTMRTIHNKGRYILDHGRADQIVTVKMHSEQFVLLDVNGVEQVIDRATFDESAVLVDTWAGNGNYLNGYWDTNGDRRPQGYPIQGGPGTEGNNERWSIDLRKVPADAFVFGYAH